MRTSKPKRRYRDIDDDLLKTHKGNVTAIKTKLQKRCKNENVFKKINEDVNEMSAYFVEASVLINYKLHKDWGEGNFSFEKYKFLDYYYQLMRDRTPRMRQSHGELDFDYKTLRDNSDQRRLYDTSYRSNLFIANANQFSTLFHNNIWMHAEKRLRAFFKRFTSDAKIIDETLHSLFNEDSGYTQNSMLIANAMLYLNYDDQGFYDIEKPTMYHKYIEVFYNLLRYNRENGLKSFRMVPLLKHGAHHLQYDSKAFCDLLISLGLYKGKRTEMPNSVWSDYFDLRGLERPKVKFGFSLQTDGLSVSFSMTKFVPKSTNIPAKKRKIDAEVDTNIEPIRQKYNDGHYKNIIGWDTGLRLTVGAIRLNEYDRPKLLKMSSAKFHHLAGYNKRLARLKKYVAHREEPHTIEPIDFVAYTTHRLNNFHSKQEAYCARWIRKMSFDKYCETEKTAKKFADEIVGYREFRHKTLVFVGDTRIAGNSPMRGFVRTPVRKILKHLRNIANVVGVNEFRTTRLCSTCHNPVFVSPSTHRYLICDHCHGTWNRDINAARNIYYLGVHHILLEQPLPVNFSRNTKINWPSWKSRQKRRKPATSTTQNATTTTNHSDHFYSHHPVIENNLPFSWHEMAAQHVRQFIPSRQPVDDWDDYESSLMD